MKKAFKLQRYHHSSNNISLSTARILAANFSVPTAQKIVFQQQKYSVLNAKRNCFDSNNHRANNFQHLAQRIRTTKFNVPTTKEVFQQQKVAFQQLKKSVSATKNNFGSEKSAFQQPKN